MGHQNTSKAIIAHFIDDINIQFRIQEYYELNPIGDFLKVLHLKPLWEQYNSLQKKGYTGIIYIILSTFLKVAILFTRRAAVKRLTRFLVSSKPDIVISVIPLVNDIIWSSTSKLNIKFFTLMIDFSEVFKNIWFQNKDQKVVVCNSRAYEQALKFGIKKEAVFEMSGALIHPKYRTLKKNSNYSTDLKKKNILLVWGGRGCSRALKYIELLENSEFLGDLVYCMGDDLKLVAKAKGLIKKESSKVISYVENIEDFYLKSSVIIGKPGPGVISEAVFLNKFLLLELNAKTLIQERYNAKWVLQKGYGEVFSSKKELILFLRQFLDAKRVPEWSCENNSNSVLSNLIYENI